MKLLVITYSYSPELTPRAFRWAAVVAQLAKAGHEVHVLCAAQDSLTEAVDGITVFRVRDWLLNASTRVSAGASSPPKRGTTVGSRARAAVRKAVRTLWRALYWPDFACGWIVPATRTARSLCASNDYDWIISVSHPFTGHVVGLLAKPKASGAQWFVDIGDPFSLMTEPSPNNRFLYSWISRAVERRVVAGADAISVTTGSTRDLYEKHFPQSTGKIRVIPPLLSLPPIPERSAPSRASVIRLVFVGTLYRELRSPKFLLSCFAALLETLPDHALELHFYGAVNDCADDLASVPDPARPSIVTHGMVSRTEVLQAMVDADVLVNIGNNSESQLASKVIEYMAVGKPILNLVSIERDTSVEALSDYPAALTLKRTDGPLPLTVIAELGKFVLNPPVVTSDRADHVRRQYSAAHVSGLYTSMLELKTCKPS